MDKSFLLANKTTHPNDTVREKFNVGVVATNGKGVSATNMVFLRTNQPPEGGNCSVSPLEGFAILTDFEVFCEKWEDPEDRTSGIKEYVISSKFLH